MNWLLVALVVSSTAIGEVAITRGMKQTGEIDDILVTPAFFLQEPSLYAFIFGVRCSYFVGRHSPVPILPVNLRHRSGEPRRAQEGQRRAHAEQRKVMAATAAPVLVPGHQRDPTHSQQVEGCADQPGTQD